MAKINLREFYPFYCVDEYIEVTEEVSEMLKQSERSEEAQRKKVIRYKAYFSLDREDGIERALLSRVYTPEEIYERKVTKEELYIAMGTLPEKQARRIYAHFFLKMSVAEIARIEGVNWTSVNRGIRQGLMRIKKILKNCKEEC